MNYTSREVVRRLKQYDMFLSSLNLATDDIQKERICDQLDKIEKQILLATNVDYEEQYLILLGEETSFFSEEKNRLHRIISLITERKKYLEDRKNKHRDITGSLVELTTFLGEDKLTSFKRNLEIIEKYEENKVRQENIIKEMKTLDVKLSEASRIVKSNTRLNDILENKMREFVSKALDKLNLYDLTYKKQEILKNHETYEYAFKIAKDNLNAARMSGDEDSILDCDQMLSEVTSLYSKYDEEVNILNLIELYDDSVDGYDELLEKREKINDILKNISDSMLYNEISSEINKQYHTIKLQSQDIENYNNLKKERETKNKILYDIEEENNSKEFKLVIDELVKNENRVREEKIRRAKQEEYQERQKKLLEEQKIEASRVRRQKLIEEAKLKEQQERLSIVKELQDKTVINPKKEVKIDIPEKKEIKANPLADKSFDDIVLNNDFDTDELFENTKIVPNKKQEEIIRELDNVQEVVEEKIENKPQEIMWEETPSPVLEPAVPIWEEPNVEKVENLFKDDSIEQEIVFKEEEKVEDKKPSIYDILENNQNIIWKTTDTKINKDTIPVIGNNNLKPEKMGSRAINSSSFPELKNKKEGDILWKETL